HIVFVYGTLKTGQPNHYILKDPDNGVADYICTAETANKWPLVIASKYNVPYLLYKKHCGKKIYGELYSVDKNMRDKMDDFEGHPRFYRRLEVQVLTADGTSIKAWAYFLVEFKPQLLELETHDVYNTYGDHGLRYVEGCERNDPEAEINALIAEIKLS
ncbi:unnamed protein product, partial [Medioppia subpectinata]